jgi:hypothetical protein
MGVSLPAYLRFIRDILAEARQGRASLAILGNGPSGTRNFWVCFGASYLDLY